MKVVCLHTDMDGEISDSRGLRITPGKAYSVIDEDATGYKIVNDDGVLAFYWKGRFEFLDDTRDKKLADLGI